MSKHSIHLNDPTVGNDVVSGWPEGYWDLFGCIDDSAFVEQKELSTDNDVSEGLQVENWAEVRI